MAMDGVSARRHRRLYWRSAGSAQPGPAEHGGGHVRLLGGGDRLRLRLPSGPHAEESLDIHAFRW